MVSRRKKATVRVKKLELGLRAHFRNDLIVDKFELEYNFGRLVLPKFNVWEEVGNFFKDIRKLIINVIAFQYLRICKSIYPYLVPKPMDSLMGQAIKPELILNHINRSKTLIVVKTYFLINIFWRCLLFVFMAN